MPSIPSTRRKTVERPIARLRKPAATDGAAVNELVAACPPLDPNSLHPDSRSIWQVAVSPDARGHGLGQRLVLEILARPRNANLRYLRTTITGDNAASWAMFGRLARDLDAPTERHLLFDADRHFAGRHDSELELVIGPFDSARIPH